MAKQRKTLKRNTIADILEILKLKITDKKLTIQELAENTDLSQEMVEFYLNSEAIEEFSRILEFMKIGLYYNHFIFNAYKIYDAGTQLKITRVIEPRCSVYFDRKTQGFYRFEMRFKRHFKLSDTRKQLILNEMKDFYEDYENKLQ
mgnify:FL=1